MATVEIDPKLLTESEAVNTIIKIVMRTRREGFAAFQQIVDEMVEMLPPEVQGKLREVSQEAAFEARDEMLRRIPAKYDRPSFWLGAMLGAQQVSYELDKRLKQLVQVDAIKTINDVHEVNHGVMMTVSSEFAETFLKGREIEVGAGVDLEG